jgi:hypothetical protein
MRRFLALISILLATVGAAAGVRASTSGRQPTQSRSSNFELVGHNPLFGRGMNAALAIYRHFVYVGDRTDGGDLCVPPSGVPSQHGCPHSHPGVLVLNAADPAHPTVVDRIGPPLEGNVGETARELRVWPQQHLLMVFNFACGAAFGDCTSATVTPTVRFYDLTGRNAAHPKLISTYRPSTQPHEIYFWIDPHHRHRALLFMTTFENDNAPLGAPNLIVTDISRARQGIFHEIAKTNVVKLYPKSLLKRTEVDVHSISLTPDGRQAYLSVWGGTFLVLDTSQFAQGAAHPHFRLLTPIANRPRWPNAHAHSAVRIPGTPYVLTTDEVYGNYTTPFDIGQQTDGCPWGWVHIINVADPAHPVIVAQYRLRQNHASYCQTAAGQNPRNTDFTSYATHNPTVLPDLAFIAWHSNGLQAVNLASPLQPASAGFFRPAPLKTVVTADPALGRNVSVNKVIMWSYPVISKGLIYVVDIRNGLYILRYTGPHASEVARVRYLEGNSNRGTGMKFR